MADEGEMESIGNASHNAGNETGSLVEVTFQKTPYQTQKYLEAEPKALGVTQIMLSLFYISVTVLNLSYHFSNIPAIISIISSSVSIIAGSVAIAAQNLHLPTLKACLGMQVVACVLSVISFIIILGLMADHSLLHFCWDSYHNGTSQKIMCERVSSIYEHITGIEMLVQATLVALSATLAAFCCKVIQCCSPRNSVPVIVVNAAPVTTH